MKKGQLLIILAFSIVSTFSSCRQKLKKEVTSFAYFNKPQLDSKTINPLIAVTDEEYLQFGSRVAYLNTKGDTVIPFGKYAFLGTDTLIYYANVIEFLKDSSYGKWIAIDRNQNTLYDIVSFDNGPDYFKEGLGRGIRKRKMGFANEYGQIVIPCKYDFAWWFEDGKAKVTFKARDIGVKYDEHSIVESDEWFYIDKNGKRVN